MPCSRGFWIKGKRQAQPLRPIFPSRVFVQHRARNLHSRPAPAYHGAGSVDTQCTIGNIVSGGAGSAALELPVNVVGKGEHGQRQYQRKSEPEADLLHAGA